MTEFNAALVWRIGIRASRHTSPPQAKNRPKPTGFEDYCAALDDVNKRFSFDRKPLDRLQNVAGESLGKIFVVGPANSHL